MAARQRHAARNGNAHDIKRSRVLTGWRKIAGDIAVFMVMLQLFAPLIFSGLGLGVSSVRAETPPTSLTSIKSVTAICTATGIIYVPTGDGPGPVPVSADCPFCQLQQLITAPPPSGPTVTLEQFANSLPRPPALVAEAPPAPWAASASPRAPPL